MTSYGVIGWEGVKESYSDIGSSRGGTEGGDGGWLIQYGGWHQRLHFSIVDIPSSRLPITIVTLPKKPCFPAQICNLISMHMLPNMLPWLLAAYTTPCVFTYYPVWSGSLDWPTYLFGEIMEITSLMACVCLSITIQIPWTDLLTCLVWPCMEITSLIACVCLSITH